MPPSCHLTRPSRAVRRRRAGSVSLEMLLVFPLLLALLLGTIVFSLWLTAQPQVTLASREGAILIPAGTYGNITRFLPPLVISDAELDEGLDVVERCLARVTDATSAARSSSVATT